MRERGVEKSSEIERGREGKSFALIIIAEFYSICDSHLTNVNEQRVHTHPHTLTHATSYRQLTELSARLDTLTTRA